MKIYSTYSDSHTIFLPWFNTIKNVEKDIEIITKKIEQKCPTGEFNSEGWNEATKQKIEFLIDIVSSNDDDMFIFSDVDVQFFKPVCEIGKQVLSSYDIVFQNDYYGGECTGFFYCRKNIATKKLFEYALKIHNSHRDDQTSIQSALRATNINYALLPKEFFTYGMYYDHWKGQEVFRLPKNIVMHHANWVVGIENKINLLKAAKNNFDNQIFL